MLYYSISVLSLCLLIWGYWYVLTRLISFSTATSGGVANTVNDLLGQAVDAVEPISQHLPILGPLVPRVENFIAGTLENVLALIVPMAHNVRDRLIWAAVYISGILILQMLFTFIGWLFPVAFLVVLNLLLSYAVAQTYDPIVDAFFKKYKFRRSIRPFALVVGLHLNLLVLTLYWYLIDKNFYQSTLEIFSIFILLIVGWGFMLLYKLYRNEKGEWQPKFSDKAGVVLNTASIILLAFLLLVKLIGVETVENVGDSGQKRVKGVVEWTSKLLNSPDFLPGYTNKETNLLTANMFKLMVVPSETALRFPDFYQDRLTNLSTTYVKVKLESGDEGYINLLDLEQGFLNPKEKTEKYEEEKELIKNQNQDTLKYDFPDKTRFKIVTKSGKPFLQADGERWQLWESGQMFRKLFPQDIVKGTVDGEKFFVIVQ